MHEPSGLEGTETMGSKERPCGPRCVRHFGPLAEPRRCSLPPDPPAAGARPVVLTVVGSTLPARTDANGHFCLVAPAGARPVDVVDPRVLPGQGQNPGTATRRIQLDFVAGAPETRVVLP